MQSHGAHGDKRHSKDDFETWASLHGLTKQDILGCLRNCEKSYCWGGVASNMDSKAGLSLSDGLTITKLIHGLLFAKSQKEVNEFNGTLQLIATRITKRKRSYSRTIDKKNQLAQFRIILRYSNKPADALNLVHEYFHCLQFYESQCVEIPPMFRELAAFIGELFFLKYISSNLPSAYAPIINAWRRDNRTYVLAYANKLLAAASSGARYSYDWNYPLARILSVVIFETMSRNKIAMALSNPSCLPGVVLEAVGSLEKRSWVTICPSFDRKIGCPSSVSIHEFIGISVMQLLRVRYIKKVDNQSIRSVVKALSRIYESGDIGLVTDYLLRPYVRDLKI
jgi:hypothetical protein